MKSSSPNRYKESDIKELYDLIIDADNDDEVCQKLLFKLGFIEEHSNDNFYRRIINSPWGVVVISTAVFIFVSTVGCFLCYLYSPLQSSQKNFNDVTGNAGYIPVFIAAAGITTCVIALCGWMAGYKRWDLAEKNRNMDDIIKRKELANRMMIDNAEVLLPYVENTFDIVKQYAATLLSEHDLIKVQMYIFTEIDNLEFVFEKSKPGLIQPQHVLRSIKIFLARCENLGFELMARKLVKMGRYNRQFVTCVNKLLNVGHWKREQTTHDQENLY